MAIELKKLTLEGGLLKASGKSPARKGASSDSDDSSDDPNEDATEESAL
jgi:hypothetical protein